MARTFCGQCGTPLTWQRLDNPESIDVTAGSLDDPEVVRPDYYLWTARRLSWVHLSDDLPEHKIRRID